jgi:hypothetical protein
MVSHTAEGLILFAVIIFIVIIASWFLAKWYLKDHAVVENLSDQSTVYISGGNKVAVSFAEYSHGCRNIDVKHKLNKQLENMVGSVFLFDATTMGLPPGGRLSFTYKCRAASH